MRSIDIGLAMWGICTMLACQPSGSDREQASYSSGGTRSSSPRLELAKDAPDSVINQLRGVLETTDDARPGASTASLRAFLEEHRGYNTDAVVHDHIERFGALSDERYHTARDLAREGSFDEAERILLDLATHLPETSGGRKAIDHLAFSFYLVQAQQYMVRQRFTEAGDIARSLLKRDLTVEQAQQAEQILDSVGQATTIMGIAERHNAESEVRHIMIALATAFVEEGRYPRSLSLEWLENYHYYSGSARTIGSIEDYRTTNDNFSFTAVTKSGKHRIRVVNGQLQN